MDSFSFSEGCLIRQNLKPHIKTGFLPYLLDRDSFMFSTASGKLPLPRRAPHFCGVRCFLCPRFVAGIFFVNTFQAASCRSQGANFTFVRFALFLARFYGFRHSLPSAEVIGSFPRLFLFFAVPSEPKSLGSLIYEPSLPQERWFSKRDAASRGSCISFS